MVDKEKPLCRGEPGICFTMKETNKTLGLSPNSFLIYQLFKFIARAAWAPGPIALKCSANSSFAMIRGGGFSNFLLEPSQVV